MIDLPVFCGLALLREVVEEDGTADFVAIVISIDDILWSGAADHVVVEVESNLVSLLWCQL